MIRLDNTVICVHSKKPCPMRLLKEQDGASRAGRLTRQAGETKGVA